MKKWHYMTITAKALDMSATDIIVTSIEGDRDAPVVQKKKWLLGSAEKIRLSDYLNSAGEEGWEVTGISPLESSGSATVNTTFVVILKHLTTDE